MQREGHGMSKHFAIGLVVDVKDGAKPAGWGDDAFTEDVPKGRQVSDVAASEDGAPLGSYEVAGWYWLPTDIIAR